MQWSVLFGTSAQGPFWFASNFVRLADRCLYHSTNVWSQFISDLNVPVEFLKRLSDDAIMQTQDVSSKYEIEAYLGAAKVLFEKNFIGVNEFGKQNLLGRGFAAHPNYLARLEKLFATNRAEFSLNANKIRNHSYHLNPQSKDRGFLAGIKKANGGFAVTIPNIYVDDQGKSIDLAELFILTHQSIETLLLEVRNILVEFFFQHDGVPSNRKFQSIRSPYGTMMVNIGPNGFEFSDFHEVKEKTQKG